MSEARPARAVKFYGILNSFMPGCFSILIHVHSLFGKPSNSVKSHHGDSRVRDHQWVDDSGDGARRRRRRGDSEI